MGIASWHERSSTSHEAAWLDARGHCKRLMHVEGKAKQVEVILRMADALSDYQLLHVGALMRERGIAPAVIDIVALATTV